MHFYSNLVAIICAILISLPCHSQRIQKQKLSIGETITLQSEILHEQRILNIYLPNSYHLETDKSYPVVYLLDGTIDEDFIHIAGLIQFGSFSWINMVEESIVVGIANIDRKKDFTFPTTNEEDKKNFPTTGNSKNFIRYIKEEIVETVTSNYRTTDHSTIIGQSLGGLLATELLFAEPDLFNKYIIVSPSMWWDDGSLFDKQPSQFENTPDIFIAVGAEGPRMETDAMKLYVALLQQIRDENKVGFSFLKERTHGDALHLAVYNALEFFNKNRQQTEE